MAEMKNQKLLNKALNLLPDLVETKVDAVQTVELYKNATLRSFPAGPLQSQSVFEKGFLQDVRHNLWEILPG